MNWRSFYLSIEFYCYTLLTLSIFALSSFLRLQTIQIDKGERKEEGRKEKGQTIQEEEVKRQLNATARNMSSCLENYVFFMIGKLYLKEFNF